jgi:hypothetical protein
VGLLLLTVYTTGLFQFPNQPVFWSPDEGGRYLDMRQIAEHERWRNPLPYLGRFLDPDLKHLPLQYHLVRNGEPYSWWPSTFPALSSVPYRWLGLRGIYLVPLLSSLLVCFATCWILSSLSRGIGFLAMAVTALASPIAFYGFTFWEHTLQCLLILLATASAAKSWRAEKPLWAGIGGLLLGLATYFRIETAIFVAGIGLAGVPWARRHKAAGASRIMHSLLWFFAVYSSSLAPMLVNTSAEDPHYLQRHYSIPQRLYELPDHGFTRILDTLPDLLIGSPIHGGIHFSYGLAWIGALAAIGAFFAPYWIRTGKSIVAFFSVFVLLGLSSAAAFSPREYISIHGIILVAPFITFVGWSLLPPASVTAAFWGHVSFSCALSFLLVSAAVGWEGQGGLQWGPRYALPLIPIMIVATSIGVHRLYHDHSIRRTIKAALLGCFILMVLVGFGLQVRGLAVMKHAKVQFAVWHEQLHQLPKDVLLWTDSPVLASNLPGLYESRAILRLDETDAFPQGWEKRAHVEGFKRVCQLAGFATGTLWTNCSDIDIP